MATDSETSSDESFVGEIQSDRDGLQGYQFEPRREHSDDSQEESPDDEEETDRPTGTKRTDRLVKFDWCNCGKCSVDFLQAEKECVCCSDRPATMRKTATDILGNSCVTNHPDFDVLCVNPAVLRNVLVSLNSIRMDQWDIEPPLNKGFRYAAYRQFSWWAHGKLGYRKRRVVPACAVNKIRMRFPKGQEEEYVEYISANESD